MLNKSSINHVSVGNNCSVSMADCSLVCMAPTEHLKMMRLLFLCLLLPAAIAFSEESEGSAVGAMDDEDLFQQHVDSGILTKIDTDSLVDKTTGAEDTSDQFTLIVIVVAVTVLTLSVATVVTIMLVRRYMNKQQQGIYSVPTEQDQKGAV